jgi:invasion protein IalB
MRFLISFILVIVVLSGFLAAFVVPPEQWRPALARLTGDWVSNAQTASVTNALTETMAESASVSAQPLSTAAPLYQAIRKVDGIPIGDWIYDCEAGSQRPCVIAFQTADKEDGSIVFSWLIGADADGNLQAVWQTPTGVLVNRGLVLEAGTEKPIALPYTACVAGYCEAVANLAPDFVQTLVKTAKAQATVYTASGQTLTFPISIDGLADGIVALRNRSRQG